MYEASADMLVVMVYSVDILSLYDPEYYCSNYSYLFLYLLARGPWLRLAKQFRVFMSYSAHFQSYDILIFINWSLGL